MTFVTPLSKNAKVCFLKTIRNISTKQRNAIIKRPTLFQRFIKTCREYWYVAIPVHVVSSSVWFTGCYYITQKCVFTESIFKNLMVLYILAVLTY